ncbi:phage antirepressor [Escherichia coli O145:H28]|nr:phage antirepressor [Escherichia coli O145:H28]
MTTQISVETLSPITHNQIPVITTELLAQLYGAGVKNIQNNYARNAERFIEGKHFFKVAGDALKNLRVALNYSQNLQPSLRGLQISPKARSLILWTERGAARHAKMLETDQAWDVNRPGFPGECFICELRLPDHRFRWKHNKLFLLLPEEYGPAFPAIVDCYTSPPT